MFFLMFFDTFINSTNQESFPTQVLLYDLLSCTIISSSQNTTKIQALFLKSLANQDDILWIFEV